MLFDFGCQEFFGHVRRPKSTVPVPPQIDPFQVKPNSRSLAANGVVHAITRNALVATAVEQPLFSDWVAAIFVPNALSEYAALEKHEQEWVRGAAPPATRSHVVESSQDSFLALSNANMG